jgi:hypothetical protein
MQPTFEAVDLECPLCQAAAVVYVPSNLKNGVLELCCYGCGKNTIEYDKSDWGEILAKRMYIKSGE